MKRASHPKSIFFTENEIFIFVSKENRRSKFLKGVNAYYSINIDQE